MATVGIHNGFELVDYIHAGKYPAIRIQYRINANESNVIGLIRYGEGSKYNRKLAIKKAREIATTEEFEHQRSLFI